MRFCIIASVILFSFKLVAQQKYTGYVNPFVGTGGHGHTFPGATMPHGMVQLSPDTRLEGWDGCGGYHYSDSFIYGFSHTHLSGTGVSDYGDILIMPMRGEPSPDNKVYGSAFSHATEAASPGFYKVRLEDDDILAELTSTLRTGFHSYTFNHNGDASFILDLKHRDKVIGSSVKIVSQTRVEGHRESDAWAKDQHVYFVMEFSKPFTASGIWNENLLQKDLSELTGNDLKAYFKFNTSVGEKIMLKVGISSVSIEGALKNLEAENKGWDFNGIKNAAERAWENELSRIEINSSRLQAKRIFYTALYHTLIVPNINMDVDRQYRGRDNKIHVAQDFTNYSVFSLWDTYRAAHPLYTIIDREKTLDYIKTFLAQYQQGGRLPVWELSSNETDCMIGYHSVPVIVDAALKGIDGFDKRLALEAMKKSAHWDHLGLPALTDHGFIGMEDEHENVSKTLEYAYDDWCIAQFAKHVGASDDYKNFIKRAQYYKNLLDPKSGFIRPRSNGNWLTPFDPREVNNNYTEANGWQYNFYAQQDLEGYIKLLGGKKRFTEKLDSFFTISSFTGREQSDITGLIGQYAHGNEPSHHIAYLYNFSEKPHKTQELIHRIMEEMYHDTPDGLIGNEDCGQMSAWYVLSALGFYPVTPASNEYVIGAPLFNEAKIHLENGKIFTIRKLSEGCVDKKNTVPDLRKECVYIKKISLNGEQWSKGSFRHDKIALGGMLSFIMTGDERLAANLTTTPTLIQDEIIVVNPVIDGGERSFNGMKKVTILNPTHGPQILYTTDGSNPTTTSKKYTGSFYIESSQTIKAIAVAADGKKSLVTTAKYFLMPHNWSIRLNSKYENQYSSGGPNALIDGIRGSTNWRMGNWQGYQGENLDAVIDLGAEQTISKVIIGLLQETRSWIVMPKEIIIETSLDNKNFTEVYRGKNYLPIEDMQSQVKNIEAGFAATHARYVRVIGVQYGKLPSWHESPGGETHLFVDEIDVK